MRFFVLDHIYSVRFANAYCVEKKNLQPAPRCEACGGALSLMPLSPPIRVELDSPRFGDFISYSPLLSSSRVVEAIRDKKLNGITKFYPVEIVRVKRNPLGKIPPPYYLLVIARTKTQIDEEASEVSWEGQPYSRPPTCNVCRIGIKSTYHGLHVIEETWTGEDIFYAVGWPGTILVTQRFVDMCVENGFTNVKFIRAEEYQPASVVMIIENKPLFQVFEERSEKEKEVYRQMGLPKSKWGVCLVM